MENERSSRSHRKSNEPPAMPAGLCSRAEAQQRFQLNAAISDNAMQWIAVDIVHFEPSKSVTLDKSQGTTKIISFSENTECLIYGNPSTTQLKTKNVNSRRSYEISVK